jgi:hypothetical protein
MQGVRCPKTDEVDEVDATRIILEGVACGVNIPTNVAVDIQSRIRTPLPVDFR